jgi:hypothetical protein
LLELRREVGASIPTTKIPPYPSKAGRSLVPQVVLTSLDLKGEIV